MAISEQKRQKKLQRKKAKQKQKKRELIKEKNRGLSEQMAEANSAPILDCHVGSGFWETGMANVLISRELPRNQVAVAMFLVDRYCLGVKDALGRIVSRGEYQSMLRDMQETNSVVSVSPATLRALVEDAIEFAHRFEFEPHRDYQKVKSILSDIDPGAAEERFDFGDPVGVPHYINGPSDSPIRREQIYRQLEQICGPEGFGFTLVSRG